MHYVIGSGPSGVACAVALLRRGIPVTMLDAGGELEEDRRAQVQGLQAMDPAGWHGPAVAFMKAGVAASRKGVGVKRVFGSDYPYRDADRFMPLDKHGVDTRSSLAAGGFSTVWGAAILPFRQEDIGDWPIGIADPRRITRRCCRFSTRPRRRTSWPSCSRFIPPNGKRCGRAGRPTPCSAICGATASP